MITILGSKANISAPTERNLHCNAVVYILDWQRTAVLLLNNTSGVQLCVWYAQQEITLIYDVLFRHIKQMYINLLSILYYAYCIYVTLYTIRYGKI